MGRHTKYVRRTHATVTGEGDFLCGALLEGL